MEHLVTVLRNNTDSLVAAGNFTIAVLMSILAVVILHVLVTREKVQEQSMWYFLTGFLMEAVGWAMHRTYWGLWRYGRDKGWTDWDAWFIEHAYVALVPVAIIILGLAIVLIPVWQTFTGRNDRVYPTLLALGTFWFFYWALDDRKPDVLDPPTNEPWVEEKSEK